jgi:hypothetical protein
MSSTSSTTSQCASWVHGLHQVVRVPLLSPLSSVVASSGSLGLVPDHLFHLFTLSPALLSSSTPSSTPTTAGCCALKIVVEAFSTGPSDDSAPPSHLRYWQYRSLQSCQSHFSGLQTRECLARRLHTTLTSTHTPSSTRRHLRLRHVLRYTTIMALPRSLVASCAAPYPQQP